MKFANYSVFSTDLHRFGIDFALEHTEKLGFNAIEWIDVSLDENRRIKSTDEAKELSRKISDKGFDTACYSLLVNLQAPEQDKTIDGVYRHIEYAAIMGFPFVHHTVVPGYNYSEATKPISEMISLVADGAEKIAKRCNEYGITCLYEPQGLYFNGVAGLAPLLTEMKKRATNVGVCGDVGNCLYVDDDPVTVFEAFAPEILHVHMKDYTVRAEKGDNPTTKPSRGGRWLTISEIGAGDIDLVGAMRALKNVDYDGAFALEVAGDDDFMRRSIEYLKSVHCQVYGN